VIKMAHAEQTIVINRPVKEVFDFVLDGTRNTLWRPSVVDVQAVAGKPSGAGAVFKQGLKGPGGGRIDGDYQIIEVTPDAFIKFNVIAGPARPTGTYQFEAVGGGTKVTFVLDYQAKGLAKLMEPMINRAMREEVGNLSNLKAYMEKQG
jgi:uncharacterized membrane protein